jgi:hypothetical protein
MFAPFRLAQISTGSGTYGMQLLRITVKFLPAILTVLQQADVTAIRRTLNIAQRDIIKLLPI